MQVTLTPEAEQLLNKQLQEHPGSTPEQIIEKALQTMVQSDDDFARTPAEAARRIRELQKKGLSLGGITIKDAINQGRRY